MAKTDYISASLGPRVLRTVFHEVFTEKIEHGRNSWLVPAIDVTALREQLAALSNQPTQVLAMADQLGGARNMKQHVADLLDLYRELSPALQGTEEHA